MQASKTVLTNGLRVLTIPQADSRSVALLVVVAAGSNYETKEENGLSHFLEHMVFKGSGKFPTMNQIPTELESLGAQSNAFTSNELTGYYAAALPDHLPRLMEILSDMYIDPLLPPAEIEKERGVIIEEINMYEDQPHRKVADVLDRLLYGETPAGRTILGTKENLLRFQQADFKAYREKHYLASETVVIVAGQLEPAAAVALAEQYFAPLPTGRGEPKLPVLAKQTAPALALHFKESDQAHLRLAFRALDWFDRREPVQELLATVLGGGMSSRLFRRIRDELGAAYYVSAYSDPYTDHGVLGIRVGADKSRASQIVKEILAECVALTKTPVDERELERAKNYLIGNAFLDFESNIHLAQYYGFQEVLGKPLRSPEEWKRELQLVDSQAIQQLASELFINERLNLAVVGPFNDQALFAANLQL